MGTRLGLRAGLVFLSAVNGLVGGWALAAPHSFFVDFPGGGRHWVALLPPYNEHLVRDVGGLSLGFAVVFGAAAVTLSTVLVRAAAVGYLSSSVPHLAFHGAHLDGMSTVDVVAQLAALTLTVAAPLAVLALTRAKCRR